MISLNQTIGRVIRHSQDYGLVILLENRVSSSRLRSRLSKWIQPFLTVHDDGEDILPQISDFFEGQAEQAQDRHEHAAEPHPNVSESRPNPVGNILSETQPFADDLFQLKNSLELRDEFASTLAIIQKIDDKFFESKLTSSASEVTLAVCSQSSRQPPSISYSFKSACPKCRIGKLKGIGNTSCLPRAAHLLFVLEPPRLQGQTAHQIPPVRALGGFGGCAHRNRISGAQFVQICVFFTRKDKIGGRVVFRALRADHDLVVLVRVAQERVSFPLVGGHNLVFAGQVCRAEIL